MERGEDWEHEAVETRWTAIERQRRVARRIVAAFVLGLVALVLFLLALTPEACTYGRGVSNTCQPVTTGAGTDVLVVAGLGALVGGLWFCRSALGIHTGGGTDGR